MKNAVKYPFLLITFLATSCTIAKYETVDSPSPNAGTIGYYLADRHHLFIHQGDREYRFDSVKLVGDILTGNLHVMKKSSDSLLLPDTTTGEHAWAWKKKASWMKAPHLYIHDTIEIPMGTIYFLPQDVRLLRAYLPIQKETTGTRIGEDIAIGLLKVIVLLPFAFLGTHSSPGDTHSHSSGAHQPRGESKPTQNAKIRAFPRKDNQY